MMKFTMSKIVAVAMAWLLLPLVVAQEPVGGTLRIAVEAVDDAFDPLGSFSYYGNVLNFQVYNRLLEGDHDGTPQLTLAESFEASDDGTVWTAKLREGVLFHDGSELSAEDVKFSFDWILDPDNGYASIARVSMIEAVVIVDPLTVEFRLREPSAPFVESISMVTILPASMADDPDGFKQAPVGTGPFMLKEFRHGDRIILEAFDGHFLGRPLVGEVVFRVIPEAGTRVAELETGGVDIILPVPSQEIERVEALPIATVMQAVASDYREIALNNSVEPLNDRRVRQALSYSVDRQALVDIVWPGTATPAIGPITPNSWAWNEEQRGYSYDPERARELLAEAGYPDGIEIEYIISTREGEDREAVILQQMMAASGIRLNIVRLEWSTLVSRLLSTDYEMVRVGITQTPDPDTLMYQWYHTEGIGTWNFVVYENPQMDALLEAGRAESDRDERARIYHEAQSILIDDAPAVFMYYENRVYGVHDRVQDFQPHSNGYFAIKSSYGPDVWVR